MSFLAVVKTSLIFYEGFHFLVNAGEIKHLEQVWAFNFPKMKLGMLWRAELNSAQ